MFFEFLTEGPRGWFVLAVIFLILAVNVIDMGVTYRRKR